jgi:uncharacterized protein (TIGR02996 family)
VSARVTIQVGLEVWEEIAYRLSWMGCAQVAQDFTPRTAQYWGGVWRGGNRPVTKILILLPRLLDSTLILYKAATYTGSATIASPRGSRSCESLGRKLSALFGQPVGYEPGKKEAALIQGLCMPPDISDLTAWAAYADWLMEQGDDKMYRRGDVIATWIHPARRLKMKYGYPELVKGDYCQ